MTTYCTRNDIASIIGEPAILACIDDNQNGSEDGEEAGYVTAAIERAATEINEKVRYQYGDLTALAGNAWLKWANAYIAAWHLFARRANAPPGSVEEYVLSIRDQLTEIRWGRSQIPEQAPQYNFAPSVSNFRPEFTNPQGPIAVDLDLSTGASPVDGIKRNTARSNL